jgi:tetratricopeptide (TPR) repeat protein
MVKSLTLSISLLLVSSCIYAQHLDCSSEAVRDSLLELYSAKARQYSLLDDSYEMTYDSLLAICPNIAEAYQEKGRIYIATGNYQKVFEYNNKAVELDPARWTAYRGYLHCIYAKNYEKAVVDFVEAERLNPYGFIQDHSYAFFIALSHMELGQFDKAEAYFLKDIAQQKRGEGNNDIHFNTLLYFGILYHLMNEFDRAENYLRDCLQIYEQHPVANYYLGLTLKVTGNSQNRIYFEKAKQYILEGYKMNEPYTFVSFLRQITLHEVEKEGAL